MTREQELHRLIEELKVLRSNTRVPASKDTLTLAIAVIRTVSLSCKKESFA